VRSQGHAVGRPADTMRVQELSPRVRAYLQLGATLHQPGHAATTQAVLRERRLRLFTQLTRSERAALVEYAAELSDGLHRRLPGPAASAHRSR
jgi:hypothetical protein